MTRQFTTNLRCAACVAAIKPAFDADSAVQGWQVDLASPAKTLTVEGALATRTHVDALLRSAGYAVTGEAAPAEAPASYYPLALVVLYIAGAVGLAELGQPPADWHRAMLNFMAGFFLVFSFFKLLNLRAFADSYQTYDILARRSRVYAFAYPFLELGLGAAYLARFHLPVTNAVTLAVMLVGLAGVAQALVARRKIQCACLGTVFNLPMSAVTLVEDGAMAGMAAVMLL